MIKLKYLNPPILLCSFILLTLSILILYSASKEIASQQLIFSLIGLGSFLFLCQFDYRAFKVISNYLYPLIILLLVIVFIIGFETRGSLRWIPLGIFNIQPSEFAKPVVILVLANFWSKRVPSWRNIAKSLVLISPFLALIFKQPDLGTTLTLMFIWAGMLFASKISVKKLIVILILISTLLPIFWFTLRDFQKERVVNFLNPNSDPLGNGYNIIQSTIAVGSGQFLGKGLGGGTQSRLQFLPESKTDFIFAFLAEELGFVVSTLILGVYFFMVYYFLSILSKTNDIFGYFIIFGTVSMLLFQVTVNIGMNVGLLPITGITLPLLSYGGSSLISTLICFGLAISALNHTHGKYN